MAGFLQLAPVFLQIRRNPHHQQYERRRQRQKPRPEGFFGGIVLPFDGIDFRQRLIILEPQRSHGVAGHCVDFLQPEGIEIRLAGGFAAIAAHAGVDGQLGLILAGLAVHFHITPFTGFIYALGEYINPGNGQVCAVTAVGNLLRADPAGQAVKRLRLYTHSLLKARVVIGNIVDHGAPLTFMCLPGHSEDGVALLIPVGAVHPGAGQTVAVQLFKAGIDKQVAVILSRRTGQHHKDRQQHRHQAAISHHNTSLAFRHMNAHSLRGVCHIHAEGWNALGT